MSDRPDIQLIANVIISNGCGEVLLTRYREDDERWWLPGSELDAYDHPDAACGRALAEVGLAGLPAQLHHVESFRGRRGWHVMFNYRCETTAAAENGTWHAACKLPAMVHGQWERGVIGKVLNTATPDETASQTADQVGPRA